MARFPESIGRGHARCPIVPPAPLFRGARPSLAARPGFFTEDENALMSLSGDGGKSAATTTIGAASVDELRLRIKRKSRLKGRQADEASLAQVRELLGEPPAPRRGRGRGAA